MKKLFTLLALVWCAATGGWADTYEWSHDGQKKTLSVVADKGGSSVSTYTKYEISYGGVKYTSAVKMESATTLTFKTTKKANIIVGVALKSGTTYASADKTKLSLTTGTADPVTAATGITGSTTGAAKEDGQTVTFSGVEAGTQVIKRAGSEEGVFYIKVEELDENTVLKPTITPTWGASFGDPTKVAITCGTTGASIYYTTDGSTPTSASTQYTAAFTVSSACTVKAIATKSGMTNSEVASQAVTINDQRKISFDFSGVTLAEGSIGVTNTTSADGATYKLPNGRLYYIEGQTQTGWLDGNNNSYELGASITADKDYVFTPVFAANTVALSQADAVVDWTFATKDGAPSGGIEGKIGYYAAQTKIESTPLDVVMKINTVTGADAEHPDLKGKWNTTSADNRAQVNGGTVFTIPAVKGMVIKYGYTNGSPTVSAVKFAGSDADELNTTDKYLQYTYNGTAETIDIIDQGSNLYPYGIVVLYPVAPTKTKTPVITAGAFDFVKKGTPVTITAEAGATVQYSTDGGSTWQNYTEAIILNSAATVQAKASVEGLEDSEVAELAAGENVNASLPFVAVVYQKDYNDDTKNAVALKTLYAAMLGGYNTILVGAPDNSVAWETLCPTLDKADLVIITEAMSGGKAFSNSLKSIAEKAVAGEAKVINLKAFNYTSGRWSWGTPTNAAKVVVTVTPASKNYKLFNNCTYNADGTLTLFMNNPMIFNGDANHIQYVNLNDDINKQSTVFAYTADPANVVIHSIGDNYLFLGLSCDNFAATLPARTLVGNAVRMLIAGDKLDAINPIELPISSVGYATFCPEVDVTIPADAEAYIVTALPENDYVKLTPITGNIAKGEGVIVKGTAGAKVSFEGATTAATKSADNILVGTLATKDLAADEAYILVAQEGEAKFSLCSAGTIAAGKAYLPASGSAAPTLKFVFDDATFIQSVTEANGYELKANGAYNLAGQKVSTGYKGIVIKNGVKMIKK